MSAASRAPWGVVRSMPVTICRISATPSGRAKRTGCGAESATQATADLTYAVQDGVAEAVAAVLVGHGGAGAVKGACRGPLIGALGEVGADRGRGGRQRRNLSALAPPLPGAPGVGVDDASGLGKRGAHRGSDAARVGSVQSGERVCGQIGGHVQKAGWIEARG